ncbi:MAG TPA: hypothetical protein VMB50_16945 [Myxococcales bacterium]|nr:hypothetical protein [Myxococcales bacterium]
MSSRLLGGASLAATLAFAPLASARPLALDLGLPALSLFGQVPAAVPPPPVVLPPGPALAPGSEPAPLPPPAPDVVRLKDGRTLQGKILYSVQNGLLFHDATSQQTYVVPFGDVVDVQQGRPVFQSPTGFAPDRRLFLEAQIREVKARYDGLSLWPSIEELIAGVLGIGAGALLWALTGDVIDGVFAAILGVTGLVSLVVGVFEMASVVKRENEYKDQLEQLQLQLGQLRSENLPARAAPLVAVRF